MESSKEGEILIIPDFKNYLVKIIISTENTKFSTEMSVLEDVESREYYGRSSTRIEGETKILYDIEKPLVAFIYDNNEMRVLGLHEMMDGKSDALSMNDYVYFFSYKFCKE